MSNLSKRVQKAKELRIIPAVNGEKGCYNTYGSNDDLYRICLKSDEKYMATPDGYRLTKVFYTSCEKPMANATDPYNRNCQYCKGNTHHTVCYHCLGAIWFSLKNADWQVFFFETYHDATNGMNFGGTLAKIENNNGTGSEWCVYRKPGQKKEKVVFVETLPEQKNYQSEYLTKEDFLGAQEVSAKEQGILLAQENINLMRGPEDSDGID